MKNLILLFMVLMLITSFEKNKDFPDNDLHPVNFVNPDKNLIDINSDQITDFEIEYKEYSTHDIPSSFGSIIGFINPFISSWLLFY
ncbi:MAG: hypothetical protein ABR597_07305 [Bacteroidales bacterium]